MKNLLRKFYTKLILLFDLKASKIVKAQGIGVHKPDEIVELGKEDLTTLSELLADKPFFFGDEPSLVNSTYFQMTKLFSTQIFFSWM